MPEHPDYRHDSPDLMIEDSHRVGEHLYLTRLWCDPLRTEVIVLVNGQRVAYRGRLTPVREESEE